MTTPFNPYSNTQLLRDLESHPSALVRNSVELGALDTLPDGIYRAYGELEDYIEEVLKDVGEKVVPLIQNETPVYRGALRQSTKFKISDGPLHSIKAIDKMLEFYQDAVSHGREFTGSSTGHYWQYAAFGRPPGTAPKLYDLRHWVMVKIFNMSAGSGDVFTAPKHFAQAGFSHSGIKGGQPGFYSGAYNKKTRRRGQKFRPRGPSLARIESVTYAIAQKIGARGSQQWQKKEPPYYLRALEKANPFIDAAEAKLGRKLHVAVTGWQPYTTAKFKPRGGATI